MSNNEVPGAEKREGSWAVLGVLKQLITGLRRWERKEGWVAIEGRSDRCLWWFQETQDENKSQKTGKMLEGGKANELRAAVYLIKHSPVQMESCIMPLQSPLEHWENGKEWIAILVGVGGGCIFCQSWRRDLLEQPYSWIFITSFDKSRWDPSLLGFLHLTSLRDKINAELRIPPVGLLSVLIRWSYF